MTKRKDHSRGLLYGYLLDGAMIPSYGYLFSWLDRRIQALFFCLDLVNSLVYCNVKGRYMATVNVHDAKTHLSRLLSRVESGEEIVIAKAGKPIAQIVPLLRKGTKRSPGSARGRIVLRRDFFKPLPKSLLDNLEK